MFYHLIDSPMTIAAIPLDPIPTNHSNLLQLGSGSCHGPKAGTHDSWARGRSKLGNRCAVEMAWGSLLLLLTAVFGRKDLDILDDLGIFSMSGCTLLHFAVSFFGH